MLLVFCVFITLKIKTDIYCLTTEIFLPLYRRIPSELVCFECGIPWVELFCWSDRIVKCRLSVYQADEWFVNFSNYTLWPRWTQLYYACNGRTDVPVTIFVSRSKNSGVYKIICTTFFSFLFTSKKFDFFLFWIHQILMYCW